MVLGLRCLLDCHVLKGFGIYMIGIYWIVYTDLVKNCVRARPVCSLVNGKGIESNLLQGVTAKCSRVNFKPRPNIQTVLLHRSIALTWSVRGDVFCFVLFCTVSHSMPICTNVRFDMLPVSSVATLPLILVFTKNLHIFRLSPTSFSAFFHLVKQRLNFT